MRIREALKNERQVLHVFITFSLLAFLPFLSCSASISHTHPLAVALSFSLPHTHTFMQLECQWVTRSLSTQQCNSLTAVDLCQEETQMLQQQFICWLCSHLNYRKQSRFVTVSWAYFLRSKPIQYAYIKWHIMFIFTIPVKGWWILYNLFLSNAALFAQFERLHWLNFKT